MSRLRRGDGRKMTGSAAHPCAALGVSIFNDLCTARVPPTDDWIANSPHLWRARQHGWRYRLAACLHAEQARVRCHEQGAKSGGGGYRHARDRTCVCGAPVASAADVSNLRRILLARHAGLLIGIALLSMVHRHADSLVHAGSREVCMLPLIIAIPAITMQDLPIWRCYTYKLIA